MTLSRRHFLLIGTGATLSVVLGGCADVARYLPGSGDGEGPFQVPKGVEPDLITHLLQRLSFGARPGEYQRVRALAATEAAAAQAYIAEQLAPESIEDLPGFWATQGFESLDEPLGEHYEYDERVLLRELVSATVLRAVYSRRQLYEVMVQFWSDHFNIDPSKADCRWLKTADDRDVIRAHAMGRFADLLRASALSPAMLWYLDGRANKKASAKEAPNENYARELMELHTLGVNGGYTQKDVMEVARCLTGWTVHGVELFKTGQVEFVERNHDNGEKRVLGRHIPAGGKAQDLDTVLDILVRHPSTARHIATKLCTRFIADEPGASAIAATAAAFQQSNGDIRATLRALFSTPEFLAARSNKFKLPFHFVVSALRATGAKVRANPALGEFLERMGHMPFHYPTPDGYPQEPYPWMGTLLWRWNFAAALATNRIAGTQLQVAPLAKAHGGPQGLAAHLFGRTPTAEELAAALASPSPLALAIAAPAFQKY